MLNTNLLTVKHILFTAIPYRASTGPEQGFPCVVFPHREKPVFISWEPCNENRVFPDGNTTQGKPCSHYRGGVCSAQTFQKFMIKSLLYTYVLLFEI